MKACASKKDVGKMIKKSEAKDKKEDKKMMAKKMPAKKGKK
jgi:hypothetical protein